MFFRSAVGALCAGLIASSAGAAERIEFMFPAPVQGKLSREMQKLVKEFNSSQSDVEVVGVFTGSYDETKVKSQAAAEAGKPPAVVLMSANFATELAMNDLIVPMEQLAGNTAVWIFPLCVLLAFLVLAAQFEGFTSAVVVTLIVPFGIASAIVALWLTGTSLNIYSQIGLVLLIGLMAKNSVLLVEFADQLRDEGLPVRDAIEQGAAIRLRPVAMTMISTVLGGLPLILGVGAGAEARASIGWVVFGGLGIATIFTLVLIPVLYSVLAPLTAARAHAGIRLDRELREMEHREPGAAAAAE